MPIEAYYVIVCGVSLVLFLFLAFCVSEIYDGIGGSHVKEITTALGIFVVMWVIPHAAFIKYEETETKYIAQISTESIPFIMVDNEFINLADKMNKNIESGTIVMRITTKSIYKTPFYSSLVDIQYKIGD